MAIDLTGGIDPAREHVFAQRPDDPEMRDSVSFWVFDDRGEVGLTRIGIEAMAEQLGGARPPGERRVPRRARVPPPRRTARPGRPQGPDGKPTVLGAGPLGFRCVEPFRTWAMTLRRRRRCRPRPSTSPRAGRTARWSTCGSRSRPRWRCRRGSRARSLPEAREQLESSIEGDLMGGRPLRAAVPVHRLGAGRRRRRSTLHRQRPAHPPPGGPPARRVLGPLLAVGAVPEREGVRLHRLPAA